MSDITYVGRQVREFTSAPQFDGYSRVVITVSEEVEYSAGVETGRTLSLTCPWATQAVADDILERIRGFQYQPYTAAGALLDPAAELGDAVTVNTVYSGIYAMETTFGRLFAADISAPSEEEIDHEFPYVPKQERTVTRKLNKLSSEFKVQAGLISAKVSKEGGDASSFGWDLDEKSWALKSKGSDVLYASEKGVEITGKITATSGKIGGFDIESDYLSYNGQTWMGTNTFGAYLGTNGLQMGKNFRVDMSGNLYAASGEFAGTVRAGSIQYGDEYGTLNGAALTANSVHGGEFGALGLGTISTYNTGYGINTSLGYANFSHDVFNGIDMAEAVWASSLRVGRSGTQFVPRTISFKDYNGNTRTYTVLATASE